MSLIGFGVLLKIHSFMIFSEDVSLHDKAMSDNAARNEKSKIFRFIL